jgi:hypothetical protein
MLPDWFPAALQTSRKWGDRAMKLLLSFIVAIILPALMISARYLYGQFQIFDVDDPYK